MSYNSWHDYGYGVETPVTGVTFDALRAFCAKHRAAGDFVETIDKVQKEYKEKEDDPRYSEANAVFEYEDFDSCCCGIASILKDVIWAEKNITLLASTDFNDNAFLLFTPSYPWSSRTKEDKKIRREDDIKNIVKPYLTELYGAGNEPEFDYHSVENGG